MTFFDATATAAALVDKLRAQGVRSFKGDLLAPDGSKLWSIDIVFEKPTPTRSDTHGDY